MSSVPVQVLTIFFATFLAGSFFNQVQLFVNTPASIVRILGAAAPQTASFFMSYLLLLGLTTKPVLFLRIPREHASEGPLICVHRDCGHVCQRGCARTDGSLLQQISWEDSSRSAGDNDY